MSKKFHIAKFTLNDGSVKFLPSIATSSVTEGKDRSITKFIHQQGTKLNSNGFYSVVCGYTLLSKKDLDGFSQFNIKQIGHNTEKEAQDVMDSYIATFSEIKDLEFLKDAD